MSDKVMCAICGKQMTYVNNTHLKSHNITIEIYKKIYPNSPIMTDAVSSRLSQRSIKSNAGRKGIARSEKDIAAINVGVAKRPKTNANLSRTFSLEQRKQLSENKKQSYATGIIKPSFAGHAHSDKTKEKIAAALRGRKIPSHVAQKRIKTLRDKGYDFAFFRGQTHSLEAKRKISNKSLVFHRLARPINRSVMLPLIESANVKLLNGIDEDLFHLECISCSHTFTRTPQVFFPSKFHKEICDQCFPRPNFSKAEKDVFAYIRSIIPIGNKLISNDRELIAPFELDILAPIEKVAIEYCGLYWHCEESGKGRWYHSTKSTLAEKSGVRLYHIFEDEWLNKPEIVKGVLRNIFNITDRRVFARKCDVKILSATDANYFLNENHLMGSGRSNARYGLYKDGELLSVMTFSNNELSRKNFGWEINRFCSKLGTSISGGASRLFKAFLREYNPAKVISYADLRWGDGEVYGHLGFKKIGNTVPNYWYILKNEMKRHHRYGLRKKDHEPKDKTEKELRSAQGYTRIWDCGHAKWEFLMP